MAQVITGLENLSLNKKWQQMVKGNIAYLCHSASISSDYQLGITLLKKIFGTRLKKIFGPQHGFVSDVQDNMVESSHFQHPFFELPIYSLYSETRIPSDEMLDGINSVIVDLQDVGTRVYTYISTMTLLMEKCAANDIEVIILDRPNPVGGEIIEGNILDKHFASFVGRHPIPMRHALTMGEMATLANTYFQPTCQLKIIPMNNWKRSFFFKDTGLPWVNPSPNLPTMESALTFVATVLFEGTNISEGRGTTRSLEIVGHPQIEPFSLLAKIQNELNAFEGFALRPVNFMPTFQKHQKISCGGFHIHPTNYQSFRPWKLGQFLCQKFRQHLGQFEWFTGPYEYEFEKLPIDLINGTDKLRTWVEQLGTLEQLQEIELKNRDTYLNQRENILLYRG